MKPKPCSIIIKTTGDAFADAFMISVPAEIHNQLDESAGAVLKVGASETNVKCIGNNTESSLIMSNELIGQLPLYPDMKTNLIVKGNRICLGPVIGSFTDSTSVRIAREQRAGKKLKSLSIANRDAGTILYFFSVDDFQNEEDGINGTYYNYETERWEQGTFPIPDVLYDRGGGILKRQETASEYVRQTIENNENVKKFNPRYYFDKWDTYNKLRKYEEMEKYLPLTVQYRNPEDLSAMFEKYSSVYVKDRKGNRGLGITRIRKLSDGTFELSYFEKECFKYGFNSLKEAVNKLDELYKNKRCIIQPAINVIKINGGNVDMRATVQRDGKGELGITAYPVRVGKAGVPITSTRSGSTVYRFEEFYKQFFSYSDEQVKEIKNRIDEFLFTSYKCIEDLYGMFGEIGIDFAIDNEGGIWFIECNAKPGKDTIYLSYDEDTVKKAFLNPLEYAKHICGY